MPRTRPQPAKKDAQDPAETVRQVTKADDGPPGQRANKTDGESAVLASIAAMTEPYRSMGERIHSLIMRAVPELSPRTWYGMPAYAKDGEVICFFRGGDKFKERYMTLGFNEGAKLDEGRMWPVAFALTELTTGEEERIVALVKKAAR